MADKTTSSQNQQGRRAYEGRYGDAGTQPGRGFDGAQRQGVAGKAGYMREARPLSPGGEKRLPLYGRNRQRLSDAIKRDQLRKPSLLPILYRKTNGTRSVVVTEGYVSEIIPRKDGAMDDSVIEHVITNIWDGTLLREHAITNGQIVGVQFDVDINGYISGACTISVRSVAAAKTLHHIPPVGMDGGAAGNHFIALAKLDGSGDNEKLTMMMGGCPVEYVHDTPSFLRAEASSGTDIFKQYSPKRGCYETFGLKALAPIAINQVGDDLEWVLTAGADFDLTIYTFSHDCLPVEQELTITIPASDVYVTLPEHSHTIATGTGEDYSALTPDGAHEHAVEIAEGGPHLHALEQHQHDTAVAGKLMSGSQPPFDSTGLYNFGTGEFIPDGAHAHPDTDFTWGTEGEDGGAHTHTGKTDPAGGAPVSITIPERTVTANVTIMTYKLTPSSSFIVYCWRAGLFINEYPDGVGVPALTPDVIHVTRTIHVWAGGDSGTG